MVAQKTVVIVQSSYIPWKGFFDLMDKADEFILFDDAQFTKRDWRNRNLIKTSSGNMWLTIPVIQKGNYQQRINETRVINSEWVNKHWRAISLNYARAPYFNTYKSIIEDIYIECKKLDFLSKINHKFISQIAKILGLSAKITWSTDYLIDDNLRKSERLLALCKKAGATNYLSGPSARAYLKESLFQEADINVNYIDYSNYPQYTQLFTSFIHEVTILDLLFNTGPSAYFYIRSSSDPAKVM